MPEGNSKPFYVAPELSQEYAYFITLENTELFHSQIMVAHVCNDSTWEAEAAG